MNITWIMVGVWVVYIRCITGLFGINFRGFLRLENEDLKGINYLEG